MHEDKHRYIFKTHLTQIGIYSIAYFLFFQYFGVINNITKSNQIAIFRKLFNKAAFSVFAYIHNSYYMYDRKSI